LHLRPESRATSIDTPLHAFLPFRHVDHLHPDAVIALAAAKDGERATREIYGDEVGWLPWQRPGFDLGLRLRDACRKNSKLKGIVLQNHGLISWADTSKGCYELSLALINQALDYLERKSASVAFGGEKVASRDPIERRDFVAALMPALRGNCRRRRARSATRRLRRRAEFAGSKDAALRDRHELPRPLPAPRSSRCCWRSARRRLRRTCWRRST
jgi:rhamnose utilization protein RhaD (predicted bifunctional aldolase and dehydrogenase)